MSTSRHFSLTLLFAPLLGLSLVLAACGAKPTATAIVVPTKAPPAASQPTTPPTTSGQPTTAAPKPTEAPAKGATPAHQPTEQPEIGVAGNLSDFGAEQTLGNLGITPINAERVQSSGADKPKAGDVYLLITLSVKNVDPTLGAQFYPADLTLLDNANHADIKPVELASLADAIKAQEIKPQGTLQGAVAFEVPESASGLALEFRQLNGDSIQWTVPDATLGSELRLGDLALSPLKLDRLPWTSDMGLKTDETYVMVELNIRNTSNKETAEFDPAKMILIDPATGAQFEPVSVPPAGDLLLQPVDVKPGQAVQGAVAYLVPQADKAFELKFQGLNDRDNALWDISG